MAMKQFRHAFLKEDSVTKASAKPATTPPSTPAAAGKSAATAGRKTASKATPKAVKEPELKKAATPTAQASSPSAENAIVAKPTPPARPTSRKSNSDMSTTATKVDTKLANAWKNKAGRELTEPELLAMPDSEYMSEKQLDFFRGQLTELKDDLLSNAGQTTEHLREDTSIVPDPADRATIEEEHALELRTRDRERKLLKKISQALARIESGEYGYCDETGEPIGLGRLLARPTATLSLEAQQRRELKQKMFGD